MADIEVWMPMSNGLVVESITGQAFELESAEWSDLAHARRAIIHLGHLLDDTSRVLDEEIARRLDIDNERHKLVDGVELRVNAPQVTEWDVTKLDETLSQLVNEGRLGAGVPPRCITTTLVFKTVARELTKLLTHDDPRVRELVSECRAVVPARRRVSVKESEHVHN